MTEPQDAQSLESQSNDDYIATTIPVRIDIDMKQAVLSLEEAEEVLRDANSIALGPCICRKEAQNCDAPIDVCLSLNHAEGDLYEGFKPVSVGRALEALRTSHEAGLVHLAYRKPGQPITEFCSCCSCCCWLFKKLKATGLPRVDRRGERHRAPRRRRSAPAVALVSIAVPSMPGFHPRMAASRRSKRIGVSVAVSASRPARRMRSVLSPDQAPARPFDPFVRSYPCVGPSR